MPSIESLSIETDAAGARACQAAVSSVFDWVGAFKEIFCSSDANEFRQRVRNFRSLVKAPERSKLDFQIVQQLNFFEGLQLSTKGDDAQDCCLSVHVFAFLFHDDYNAVLDFIRSIDQSKACSIQFTIVEMLDFDLDLYFQIFRSHPNRLLIEAMSSFLPRGAFSVPDFLSRCVEEFNSLDRKDHRKYQNAFFHLIPSTVWSLLRHENRLSLQELTQVCEHAAFQKLQDSISKSSQIMSVLQSKIILQSWRRESEWRRELETVDVDAVKCIRSMLDTQGYGVQETFLECEIEETFLERETICLRLYYKCLPKHILITSVELGQTSSYLKERGNGLGFSARISKYLNTVQMKLPFAILDIASDNMFHQKVLMESQHSKFEDFDAESSEPMFVAVSCFCEHLLVFIVFMAQLHTAR